MQKFNKYVLQIYFRAFLFHNRQLNFLFPCIHRSLYYSQIDDIICERPVKIHINDEPDILKLLKLSNIISCKPLT